MTAREAALRALYKLEVENLHADWALSSALQRAQLGPRDRALVTELVNGVMRWRRLLDAVLNQLLTKGKLQDLTPWIRNILRMSLYQIQFLDKIPAAAATHQAVSLAKRFGHRGTAALVNGVLRNLIRSHKVEPPYPPLERDPVGHIGLRYSHPDWMVRRWLKRYGLRETVALCRANNRVPDLVVRVNHLKATRAQLRESLAGEGVVVAEGRLIRDFLHLRGGGDITCLETFKKGWFQVQDESAGLATLLLAPEPGELILDLCSAPGGKTAHLAEMMDDGGVILAVDRYSRRLRDLVSNCRRLDISSVRPLVADGRSFWVRPVDRVLVDAPCSGLGVLARRSDLRWRKREEDISQLTELQLHLLESGANLLKPGGVLVYSTCTIEDEENEEVVERLLRRRHDLILENAASSVPPETVTEGGFVRTFPHRHGLDGTFGARLRKKKNGCSL
jgi:16S rRNA (cytosine967-C5)-methyltransferase